MGTYGVNLRIGMSTWVRMEAVISGMRDVIGCRNPQLVGRPFHLGFSGAPGVHGQRRRNDNPDLHEHLQPCFQGIRGWRKLSPDHASPSIHLIRSRYPIHRSTCIYSTVQRIRYFVLPYTVREIYGIHYSVCTVQYLLRTIRCIKLIELWRYSSSEAIYSIQLLHLGVPAVVAKTDRNYFSKLNKGRYFRYCTVQYTDCGFKT